MMFITMESLNWTENHHLLNKKIIKKKGINSIMEFCWPGCKKSHLFRPGWKRYPGRNEISWTYAQTCDEGAAFEALVKLIE